MKDDELVEALADRLLDVAYAERPGTAPITLDGPMVAVLSREVIRQMRWAQCECVELVDSFGAGNSWIEVKPLTVAPPSST